MRQVGDQTKVMLRCTVNQPSSSIVCRYADRVKHCYEDGYVILAPLPLSNLRRKIQEVHTKFWSEISKKVLKPQWEDNTEVDLQ